jgi:uncharacterized protein (TIGR01777 family)
MTSSTIQNRVLIAGGTGTIGKSLVPELIKAGYRLVLLTRKKKVPADTEQCCYRYWNPTGEAMDSNLLEGVHTIINLAGSGVMDQRWTSAFKKEILQSRVRTAEWLIAGLNKHSHQVQTWINASAIGWYGPDREPHQPFVETDAPYPDFLGNTCVAWENSTNIVESMGIRVAKLRIGIVLSPHGGAFAEFVKPLRFRVAPILGSGSQMISWIHANDLSRIIIHLMEHRNLNGIFNAVAPHPVTNRQLMLTLANMMYGKVFIPINVPAFALKIMLGESSIEILKSTTVSADKILKTGFEFQFQKLEAAIPSLINPSS